MPQQNTRTLTPWERAMEQSINGVPMATVLEQYHEAVTKPLVAALGFTEAVLALADDRCAEFGDFSTPGYRPWPTPEGRRCNECTGCGVVAALFAARAAIAAATGGDS